MENTNFESFGLTPELMKSLEKLGFKEPTTVQAKSIPVLLTDVDVAVQAPTGTGKTAAFGIPIIEKLDPTSRDIQALILSPTRELTMQIADVLRKLSSFKPNVRVLAIYGGERIEHQISSLRRKPQIVVATPGRLIDHLQRKTIRLGNVSTVVLDEADQMLDMGFRPDLNKILGFLPETRQTALYSATFSPEIQQIANSYQTNPEVIKVEQKSLTVDSVEQYYSEVAAGGKTDALAEILNRKELRLCLVFVNTRRMADKLAGELSDKKIRSAALHGDMRQSARDRVMDRYRRGNLRVLVATDVAARGIDVDDISAVINYDIPLDSESYIHRIGRTGRADQKGIAYTFIYSHERQQLVKVINTTKATITAMEGTDPTLLTRFIASPDKKRGSGGRRQPSSHSRDRRGSTSGSGGRKRPSGESYGEKKTGEGYNSEGESKKRPFSGKSQGGRPNSRPNRGSVRSKGHPKKSAPPKIDD